MIPWQTQAQQQCTAVQQMCTVYSCVKDCLLSNQHTNGLDLRSSAEFISVQCLHGHSGSSASETFCSEYTASLFSTQKNAGAVCEIKLSCGWHPYKHPWPQWFNPPFSPLLHPGLIAPLRVMLTRLAK